MTNLTYEEAVAAVTRHLGRDVTLTLTLDAELPWWSPAVTVRGELLHPQSALPLPSGAEMGLLMSAMYTIAGQPLLLSSLPVASAHDDGLVWELADGVRLVLDWAV